MKNKHVRAREGESAYRAESEDKIKLDLCHEPVDLHAAASEFVSPIECSQVP